MKRTDPMSAGFTAARTIPFQPPAGSALDPLVEEITWAAWRLASADPTQITDATLPICTGGFDRLVERAWQPGRTVIITELQTSPNQTTHEIEVEARLAVAAMGPADTTAAEVEGLRVEVESCLGTSSLARALTTEPIDPARVVPSLGGDLRLIGDVALIRQHLANVDAGQRSVEVLSRFHPLLDPWTPLLQRLVRFPEPILVRATLLATERSPMDRLELDDSVRALHAAQAIESCPEDRATRDRALATLVDLKASFASSLFVSEVAVASENRLPEALLRVIASCFTSGFDVHRGGGQTFVASNAHLLGGYEIDRSSPRAAEALAHGLPLYGGLAPRGLRDLVTLAESPIGWPIPIPPEPLPGIPAKPTITTGDVPEVLSSDCSRTTTLLTAAGHEPPVALPVDLRTRHTLVTGTWGSGKSTLLGRLALDDLRNGRGFVYIDPHGTSADWLLGHAEHHEVQVVTIDADDADSDRIEPVARLRPEGTNRADVEQTIAQFAGAIASSLPDPLWCGPRWEAVIRAALEVQSVHGCDLQELVTWINDGRALRKRLDHPKVSRLAQATLANLCHSGPGSDAADVRGWASSKLHVLVSGPARRILAAPGKGYSVASAVESGTPIIANLSGLASSEAALVGHLLLTSVRDAAIARGAGAPALYSCYVDEVHRFPAHGLSRIIVEGRKFGVGLVCAAQSLSQLHDDLADLALGAGTHVAFRCTPDSARALADLIGQSPHDLVALRDLQAVVAVQGQGSTSVDVAPIEPSPREHTKTPPSRTEDEADDDEVTQPTLSSGLPF